MKKKKYIPEIPKLFNAREKRGVTSRLLSKICGRVFEDSCTYDEAYSERGQVRMDCQVRGKFLGTQGQTDLGSYSSNA